MMNIVSEVFSEANSRLDDDDAVDDKLGRVKTYFPFHNPNDDDDEKVYVTRKDHLAVDKDGDLVLTRQRPRYNAKLIIEHFASSDLRLVGRQVWRGSLLLADYLLHQRDDLRQYQMIELGAGVGLTSISAAVVGMNVVLTDLDIGDILEMANINIQRNYALLRGNIQVLELDFKREPAKWSKELLKLVDDSEMIVAADVIYDNSITDAFVNVLQYVFDREVVTKRKKFALIALEKRYVFTLSDLEAVPPMFDYFLSKISGRKWNLEYIPIDFPKYFKYKRSEHLVLLKLTSGH